GPTSSTGHFPFAICGKNADENTVINRMPASPFWFGPNVARHETHISQFCDSDNPARTQSAPYCFGGANVGLPILDLVGAGYGTFQLDPVNPVPPLPGHPVSVMWDWRANVDQWQTLAASKAGNINSTNPSDANAYPFWARQV